MSLLFRVKAVPTIVKDILFITDIHRQLSTQITSNTFQRLLCFWLRLGDLETESGISDYLFELGTEHASHTPVETTTAEFVNLVDEWLVIIAEALPGKFKCQDQLRCRHIWMSVWYMFRAGFCNQGNTFAPRCSPLAILFTDIECSTTMWRDSTSVNGGVGMFQSLKRHMSMMRRIINQTQSYEVKTTGDGFMIACPDSTICLLIAILLCYRDVDNIPMRIGFHQCNTVFVHFDMVHRRYDYYGLDVNIACRVATLANAGQILLTDTTYKWIHNNGKASMTMLRGTLQNRSIQQSVIWESQRMSHNLKGVGITCIREVVSKLKPPKHTKCTPSRGPCQCLLCPIAERHRRPPSVDSSVSDDSDKETSINTLATGIETKSTVVYVPPHGRIIQ
jgi:class 3 adenylate cyclase